MPSVVTRSHRFRASWEDTTFAFWNKYPSKDLSHVKDVLVLERYVDSDGILHSKRLIHMDQKVPTFLKTFSGGLSDFYAIEESTVDPKAKRLVLKTKNLTFSSIVNVDETCVYTSSEDNETDYAWEFECVCSIPYVNQSIEKALTKQAHGNSSTGLRKMQELTDSVKRKLKLQEIENERRTQSDSTVGVGFRRMLTSRKNSVNVPGLHKEGGNCMQFKKAFPDFNDWSLQVDGLQETPAAFINLVASRLSMLGLFTSRFSSE